MLPTPRVLRAAPREQIVDSLLPPVADRADVAAGRSAASVRRNGGRAATAAWGGESRARIRAFLGDSRGRRGDNRRLAARVRNRSGDHCGKYANGRPRTRLL